MNRFSTGIALLCMSIASCSVHPVGGFRPELAPPAPEYSDHALWAALPFQVDSADVVPDTSMRDLQDQAQVDVFFLYPTTYTGKKGHRAWNADVYDKNLNVRTDRLSIRNQATVFNASCRVYAPRYRQAHLECFYTQRKKEDAMAALNLAYEDVRIAFEHYLNHFNEGRPLIIAAHSQGALHAAHLIRDFFFEGSNTPPLVAAYLIGMPIRKDAFLDLPPCETPDQTHCFCSWRTVDEKYKPSRFYPTGEEYAVTNPLNWTNGNETAPTSLHTGAVLRKYYEGLYPEFITARTDNGLLRVSRPKIPGTPFLPTRNYHVADYNFFYANLRENVKSRVKAYFANPETQHEN